MNTIPLAFWNAVKVEKAMFRLVTNRVSLTDVALDAGFSAPGNFSRFFKEHTGVSPSTFRRAANEPGTGPITGLPRRATPAQPSQHANANF
jgi:transcriptional regulator GlxA family with amidase domain